MVRPTLLLAALLVASDVSAISFERILLPVASDGVITGTQGSAWVSRVAILNGASNSVYILGFDPQCTILPCAVHPTPPNVTFFAAVYGAEQGGFIYVQRPYSDKVTVHLRIQDITRQPQGWGTEIPTIRERDLHESPFDLLDIPVDTAHRVNLRIYEFDGHSNATATIRFFKTRPSTTSPIGYRNNVPKDELVGEVTVPFAAKSSAPFYSGIPGPFNEVVSFGYLEMLDISSSAFLSDTDRLRIEIEPRTGDRVWGFATVTNNATQHVTIITPSAGAVKTLPKWSSRP